MFGMPGKSHRGSLPELTGDEGLIRDGLRRHIEKLAGEIGDRSVWCYPQLCKAVEYIEECFGRYGYEVSSQPYTAENLEVRNIEVEIVGARNPKQIIVIGAHYDTVPGTPGANDNGTGIASVLELARLFAGRSPGSTVRFVAFVNEEPPFFQTELMGSWQYAHRCRERNEKVVAMFSLETMGFFSDSPNSQHYPSPFNLLYPNTGNFIGFIGNRSSRALTRRAVRLFRRTTQFPSEGISAPAWIQGIGWSDQWSFWQHGYPGVMVTDTAPFRYEHYHCASDTPDKVNYGQTARVVAGLERVVNLLAE